MTELITFLENHWREVTKLEVREHEEDKNIRERNPLKRDYARVIYSTSFRRQQGKMQLFEVNSKAFHRNRLTHSFEVAQIARGIVDELKEKVEKEIKTQSKNTNTKKYLQYKKNIEENFLKMIIVVETGSLIHDVGNPPFGHHGERVLNELAPDVGFEGNAQGIRVLRKIEKKFPQCSGLNLTYRTLASIIKYFVPYAKDKKKFLYRDDYEELSENLKDLSDNNVLPFRTIDVQIVDLADEIAYCAHDLEDALASNYFTIDEFIFRLKNIADNELSKKSKKAFNTWVKNAKSFAETSGDKGLQSEDYDFYFRRELISIIVNKLIEDIGVIEIDPKFKSKTGTKNEEELGFRNYKDLAEALKTTIFKCVTSSDNIMLYERVGTKILTKLFKLFMNDEYNKNGMLMPVEYRWNGEDNKEVKARKVLDYISGMMDTYAIEVYMKHFGENPFNVKYDREIFSPPKK
ncbi:dGTP triphosphohydrolase [Streptococcus cristatus]|uniref:deoxyguanosinetriphosphate triphosphohydrolase family protein n=1 Tax=Streptococcus cristatus TaxID=45634 RepID=UPI0028D34E21|nr:dNTP triphosphohydrolase [Streptococcus cristatus]